LFQRLANGKLGALREIRNLDHGKGLEMHLRKPLFEARAEIEEILKWQVGMQPADNVEFGNCLTVSRGGCFKGFVERHGVGAGRIFLAAEGAEAAGCDANVSGIDVAIHVEIRFVAVYALAGVIGHPAYGEDIAGAVESESVVRIKALTGQHFGVNRRKTRVVRLKWMVLAQGRHPLDDIAGTYRKSQKDSLVSYDDPVTYFVILRFRDDVPRYQFVRVLEWTLRDDVVGFMLRHARQVEQVFP